ncbi:MAG: type III pantothenate kinase [Pyrinomonadaceae bacterium]
MLLAVDIGNTNIKFGIYDRETLIRKISIPSIQDLSADALANVVVSKISQPVSAAIISSVVPEMDQAMGDFITTKYAVTPIFVENDFDFGIAISYEPLSDAGSDRLVNTFSAVEKYGAPCIVCSFGTALTIDVVDVGRALVGGLIAPGMKTLSAALKTTTSKLPEVEIEKPKAVIQRSTIGSIQSGIVYGYFGLVEELLTRVKEEIGVKPKVIATGGFAAMIAENTSQIDIVDENLLLDGLQILYHRIAA